MPWAEKRIKDIGLLNTSSVDKKVKEGEKPVRLVNYMDVYTSFEKIISNDLQLMMVSANENQLIKNQVNIGDVLFTPSSETPDDIGHSAVITETMPSTLHSYHLLRLSFHEKIDLNFKRYLFNNPIVLQHFTTRAKGVTRFTLSLNDLYDTIVKLPPLDEQKAIARLLSEMDDRIIANRQIIELAKSVKKSLIAKIFE
ncbi:MAG: restriction endonuclease subunit S [Bacteroidales bacterium]